MKDRYLYLVLGLTALAVVAQGQVAPQTPLAKATSSKQTWTPPRTSAGHPDLQGFWANNNATPLERPAELAGRATLSDEELAAMKKKAHELFGGSGDAAFGDAVYLTVLANVLGTKTGFKSTDGETGDYSSVWTVERDWGESNLADYRPARRTNARPHTGGAKETRGCARSDDPSGHRARGSIAIGTLYHVRLAAIDRRIPKLLPNCADAQVGNDHDGNDS
jgi:hypothetical protein